MVVVWLLQRDILIVSSSVVDMYSDCMSRNDKSGKLILELDCKQQR